MRRFLFLDTETTGLDPRKDFLLEVAWVVTDEKFEPVTAAQSYIVDHRERWTDVALALGEMVPVVKQMHDKSGLTEDVLTSDETYSVNYINSSLLRDVEQYDGNVHLAGLSPEFDREWLRANGFANIFGPAQDEKVPVHHRLLNLSAIKLMFEASGVPYEMPQNSRAHRALNDVWESVEQAIIFQRTLGAIAVTA